MTVLPRALAPLALAAALCASGCSFEVPAGGPSQIEQDALEADITANITGEGADQVSVGCEGPLVAEVDATTDCFATYGADGSRTGIRATVTEVQGEDLAYDPVVFLDGDSVAEAVRRQLRAQAQPVADVECGELLGEVDAVAECAVSARDGSERSLTTTVTDVNGLVVDFELAPAP